MNVSTMMAYKDNENILYRVTAFFSLARISPKIIAIAMISIRITYTYTLVPCLATRMPVR